MDESEDHKVDFKQKTLKSIQKIILQSSKASAASYTLMASLIIFIFGGNYFDAFYDSSPFGLISGMCIGLAIGFYNLAKIIWK